MLIEPSRLLTGTLELLVIYRRFHRAKLNAARPT